MKPMFQSGMSLGDSIGWRFGEVIVWHRRFWGQYYRFEYEWDGFIIRVFKNMYNPKTWEDEWVQVHEFDTYTVWDWSKRPDKDD